MMHLDDDLFEHLPLPAVHWTPGHPARLNRAFTRAFGLGPLPLPLLDRPDGAHHTRLSTPNGEARICRLLLRTLPGGDRLGVIEDVHDYHADPLTRLPDRRALLLDAEQGAPVTLALLDIDGLARVNHRAGHAAGDAALHALAEHLKRAARHWPAQAYRLGGGAFVLCSPHLLVPGHFSPLQDAFAGSLAAFGVRRATFSFGLAHAPQDGTTLAELLAHAERRVQRSQRAGGGGLAAELVHLLRHTRLGGPSDSRRTPLVRV
ncbi:GGDEF domain-containing protein [Deinococcus aquaedulcis]|uniref:GGDEF domain-containing protein n=1 Tax=Deinococcus aquaedulcis TaxID=2840455 RepID=UPI001C8402D2|nr:GGDEF domain-containing protein [Deinococcus aquaedulcis]